MSKPLARAILILALTMTPLAAWAEAPHYSLVQVQYGVVETGPFDGPTYGAGVQFGGKLFQVATAFDRNEIDLGLGELTVNEWTIRGGVHGLLGEPGDLLVNVGYFYDSGDLDDDGYFLEGGIRWMIFPVVELRGFVTQVEPNDSDSDQRFNVGAIGFIETMGIGIEYTTANDADYDEWRVFLRFNFGQH